MELDHLFIRNYYDIGIHLCKLPKLVDTVSQFSNTTPYQIFLNGPQNSKMSVNEDDLNLASDIVRQKGLKVFIHAPYILNLATEFHENTWQYKLFKSYLETGVKLNARGVVIHVAKYTKQTYDSAIENMRKNLDMFKQFASIDCPILLETPSGQGTETLKGMKEFSDFVKNFDDKRIQVCVDTCHVFAAGHDPLEYLEFIKQEITGIVKLVHYNDSKDACGSCLDRHELVGEGHIGIQRMVEVAHFCRVNGIPMIIE